MRFLLILILVLVVAWWVHRALTASRRKPLRPSSKDASERVMACDHCGLHVPVSEGVRSEAGFFCSEEHRRLGSGPQ